MKKGILCLLAALVFISNLDAQQSRIRVSGMVTDASTGEALPGASIIVQGTTIGTISELNGEYEILAPGSGAVLVYSFLGYSDQEVSIGSQVSIDIALSLDAEQLDEVVVTTQARGQIGARQSQINSSTIKNVVAPDRLQENPDANAVEAIGRLPGVSVLRSGGEGSQLVIRGLEPKYTNITLDGINLASSSSTGRTANISGISQYILQGVEVYKALTPDMEANSVGGTVNLKLQETPTGFHYNFMAQTGYNDQNNYFGNYKFSGEISNRFLDEKLGVFFSASAENVNRSTHTMSAGYGLESTEVDILLGSSNLNIQNRFNERQSATLSLDYRLHRSTKLKLYGLYTRSNVETSRQSKKYGHSGAGSVGYTMAYNGDNVTDMIHTALTGETKTNLLNMSLEYGVAYSRTGRNDPDARTWNFNFAEASSDAITTYDHRKLTSEELIPLFSDHVDSLHNTSFGNSTYTDTYQEDENLTAYLDLEIPYRIGNLVDGSVKLGGKFRQKKRHLDVTSGNGWQHPFHARIWYEELPWLVMSERGQNEHNPYTLVGFETEVVDDFLGGEYDYGWYFDFDKLNSVMDWWDNLSDSLWELPESEWVPVLGGNSNIGYRGRLEASMIDDQDLVESYYAGYAMTELNIGKWIMLLPGFRYERIMADMEGFEASEPLTTPPTYYPLVGAETIASRENTFLLPMVHARIKPTDFLYFHMAYTQTISRPNFNYISPNVYVNPGKVPFRRVSQNPDLNPELWTNYDAQVTLHGAKAGLLSVSGFYKTVEDKIWNRTYKRIKSDPVVPPFGENDVVEVSLIENHPYDIYLKGVEVEWQTSFWYLPKPLSFFTLYLNYTFTDSETKYPLTRLEQQIPPEGGRPATVRIDSVVTGPMLYQPRHIANASLGFNYKGFNTWLSFQYNGEIFTSKNYRVEELDRLKEHFYRVDLQLTYDIPLKISGNLQVMGNFANLSNFREVSKLRGDPRFTHQEAYGWTVDFGLRYKF